MNIKHLIFILFSIVVFSVIHYIFFDGFRRECVAHDTAKKVLQKDAK